MIVPSTPPSAEGSARKEKFCEKPSSATIARQVLLIGILPGDA